MNITKKKQTHRYREQTSTLLFDGLMSASFPFVCVLGYSVVLHSLWPHGLWPTRLLCPWDYLGKNTGLGCHFFLQGIFPTQGLNQVSCTAGRFFTIWAPREALSFLITFKCSYLHDFIFLIFSEMSEEELDVKTISHPKDRDRLPWGWSTM